ncbi:MAG: FliO/MopB family protein [Peptococcales bacterium]|jgi:flagellar biogenesis protein FliO
MNKFKRFLIAAIIIILFFFTTGECLAESNSQNLDLEVFDQQNPEFNQPLKAGKLLIRYIFSVVGILILTYWGIRVFARKTVPYTEYGDWIQILDYMPLGTNKGFYLVEIEGKGLVLGITDQQINILATIEEQERLDELRGLSLRKKQPAKISFNLWRREKGNDFQQTLQEHIKKTKTLYNRHKQGDKLYEE